MIRTGWIAGIILMFGLLVRLYRIDQPLLEFFPERQTQTAEITRNIYVNGWQDFWTPKVRYFTGAPIPYVLEFPLYNGIVAMLYQLFGLHPILGRLTSLFFFILSSIIFYKLASPKHQAPGTRYQTLFSLLLFIFSPLHILVSRSFQPDELALFLLILAIWKRSWVVFSIAALVKLPTALFIPVMLSRKKLNRISLAAGFFSLLPAFFWYVRANRLTTHPAIVRNFDLSNWFQPQLWIQPRWYFSLFQIEHIWMLTTLGLLFFWIGFFWSIIAPRRLLAVRQGVSLLNINIWVVWLINGLLYLAIFNYHAMTHEYYHLFLLPPLSVIFGLGLNKTFAPFNYLIHWSKSTFFAGIILMIIGSLSLPAVRKIISSPKSPEESEEIPPDRYFLIEDF